MRILIIDNYDSFTYNLVQLINSLGVTTRVVQNNAIAISDIEANKPDAILLSPGPGKPEEAGITLSVIRHFTKHIPLLGVCLGHEAIAQYYGCKIISAEKIMHGKTSIISHYQNSIFKNIPNDFKAMRYHSLIVDPGNFSSELEVIAWTKDNKEIMAIQDKKYLTIGIQFHPESILTEYGDQIVSNFINRVYSQVNSKCNLLSSSKRDFEIE